MTIVTCFKNCDFIIYYFFFQTGSPYVAVVGLELMGSTWPCFPGAGIKGMCPYYRLLFIFNYVDMCVGLCVGLGECRAAGGQMRALGPLELGFQAVVSLPT